MSSSTRELGGQKVEGIGFGIMGIAGAFYAGQTESDEDRFKVLDKAYEMGCRHWDSAARYNDSELLIGKWFARTGKRNEIFLATKIGTDDSGAWNGSKEFVSESVTKALKRLQTDTIDLFYLHRVDQKTPIEITMRALADQVNAGQIKSIGLSECSATTLRRAHAVHPVAAVQMEYSPFALDIEDPKIAVLSTARELGVKTVAYSPLGRGLATGRYKSPADFEEGDVRGMMPRFSEKNFPNILKVVESLREIASAHSATPGQVVLAWLLAQGSDILPIPGTRSVKYLEENVNASKLRLSSEEIKRVREIAETAGRLEGDRYPAAVIQFTFADTPPLQE